MKLNLKQSLALDLLEHRAHSEILYGGGVGGGKSALGCYWLLKSCYQFPGSRWAMGRAQLKRLRETTLNTFWEVCRWQNVGADQYNFNQHRGIIQFKNGSEILLKDLFYYPSDPDFDSLGSLELTGAFVDEASEVVEKAITVLRARLRYRLTEFGLIPKLLMTTNPTKTWLYREFYLPNRRGNMKPNRAFVQALAKDNEENLSKFYLQSLLELDEETKQRLVFGNWEYLDDPAKLMNYECILDAFTNSHVDTVTRPNSNKRFMTCDISLHGADKFVIMVWHGWRVINLKVMDKATPSEVESTIRYMAQQHRVPRSNITYDSDGIGSYLRGVLLNARPFLNGGTPTKRHPKFREQFANLKSQCYFHLADQINDRLVYLPAKIFGKHQDDLVQELGIIKNIAYLTDQKLAVQSKKEMRSALNRSPDLADCLMMRSFFDVKGKLHYVR